MLASVSHVKAVDLVGEKPGLLLLKGWSEINANSVQKGLFPIFIQSNHNTRTGYETMRSGSYIEEVLILKVFIS